MIRHSWVQIVQEVSEERVFKSFIARIIIIWNLKKNCPNYKFNSKKFKYNKQLLIL